MLVDSFNHDAPAVRRESETFAAKTASYGFEFLAGAIEPGVLKPSNRGAGFINLPLPEIE